MRFWNRPNQDAAIQTIKIRGLDNAGHFDLSLIRILILDEDQFNVRCQHFHRFSQVFKSRPRTIDNNKIVGPASYMVQM
jgi:hypothetical protein